MANQKGSNAMYRNSILLLLLSLLCTSILFAHEHEKHVMGTVKTIDTASVSVETTSHQVQTVQITSQTKFVKGGVPSSITDLKVGDRVVIHAKPSGDKLEATEINVGTQHTASAPKK